MYIILLIDKLLYELVTLMSTPSLHCASIIITFEPVLLSVILHVDERSTFECMRVQRESV